MRSLMFIILGIILICLQGCGSHNDNPNYSDLEWQRPDSIFNTNSNYIAVIGDIQEYTVSEQMVSYLNKTCDWLRSQQRYFNCFSCVLQNGDLTWGNQDYQWIFADNAFFHLGDSILLIPSTGNHDYTWRNVNEINDRNSTRINSLVNLSVLRNISILQFESGKLDNIIVPIQINDSPTFLIALEFGPRKDAVSWADSIVRANPNNKYILMTHEWLTGTGERINQDSYAAMQMPNISHSTPEEIWQNLVYPNDNVLCVLCGHNGFCKYLFSTNKIGREVCQILFNLQYQENGGDGMIQLWEFPKQDNVINISVYNTITRKFHPDPTTHLRIQL